MFIGTLHPQATCLETCTFYILPHVSAKSSMKNFVNYFSLKYGQISITPESVLNPLLALSCFYFKSGLERCSRKSNAATDFLPQKIQYIPETIEGRNTSLSNLDVSHRSPTSFYNSSERLCASSFWKPSSTKKCT